MFHLIATVWNGYRRTQSNHLHRRLPLDRPTQEPGEIYYEEAFKQAYSIWFDLYSQHPTACIEILNTVRTISYEHKKHHSITQAVHTKDSGESEKCLGLYSFKGVLLPSHQHGPKVFIIEHTKQWKLIQVLHSQFKSLADSKVIKLPRRFFSLKVFIQKLTLAQDLTFVRVPVQKLHWMWLLLFATPKSNAHSLGAEHFFTSSSLSFFPSSPLPIDRPRIAHHGFQSQP